MCAAGHPGGASGRPDRPAARGARLRYNQAMGIRFKRNMATGLLVLVPMAAAAWILYFSFMWVDRLLWDRLRFSFVREGGIPCVGFVIVMIVVYLTGLVSNNYLGGRVVRWWEKQLLKIPLFGKIYG